MNPSYELMDRAREEYARKGVLRQEFHKGFEAGKRARTPEQWQLDMKRMEVARRVDAVTLDKGSHGNLSAIASAIYEPRFGWTSGACAMLRDTLVRLLGGAHERDCRSGRDDTGAPYPDSSDGEQAEEVMQSELVNCGNPYKAGGAVLDSGGITQYDVLGNERHKAVCRLRKVCTELDASVWTWIEDVAIAIGAQDGPNDEYESMLPKITCRLIHLLGGDEPNLTEIAETIKSGDECEVELMENGENHKMATITDELREWASDNTIKDMVLTTYPEQHAVHGILEQLIAIADRIDEQFDRICKQHEAVLQSTIDEMCDELDGLDENNAELTAKCGELQAKLDKIAVVLDGRD